MLMTPGQVWKNYKKNQKWETKASQPALRFAVHWFRKQTACYVIPMAKDWIASALQITLKCTWILVNHLCFLTEQLNKTNPSVFYKTDHQKT